MKHGIIVLVALWMLSGCAPKMGKDVLVEPVGNLRWENSKSEVMLGVLSLLGGPADKEPIRIGTDVNITNRWHSEMKLTQLTYALMEENQTLASGSARIDAVKGFVVAPNTHRILPLAIVVDPQMITLNRMVGIMQEKRKLTLKGEAVVEVWGGVYHLPFRKDASKVIAKAFKGGESAALR